jgi:hypothetical protein
MGNNINTINEIAAPLIDSCKEGDKHRENLMHPDYGTKQQDKDSR